MYIYIYMHIRVFQLFEHGGKRWRGPRVHVQPAGLRQGRRPRLRINNIDDKQLIYRNATII